MILRRLWRNPGLPFFVFKSPFNMGEIPYKILKGEYAMEERFMVIFKKDGLDEEAIREALK